MLAVLGYLSKSKKGLELASNAHVLHNFSIKYFGIHYSANWPSFNIRPYLLLQICRNMYF